jgi:broad specificity phosphatase PhoE
MMGQVLLVRHGQARFGADDYDRLSDLGREQARLLGDWLAARARRLDCAVTGSMRRHRETAEACLARMPEELRPMDDWRADAGFDEYDADEVVLCHRPEFADSAALRAHVRASGDPRRTFQGLFAPAMSRWMCGEHDRDYRESWQAFVARCVAALKRITDDSTPSRRVVVFTSGGPIAAICQHLLGLDPKRTLDVNTVLVNCATTGLLYQPYMVSLAYLNNYAHLEQSGDPGMVTYR